MRRSALISRSSPPEAAHDVLTHSLTHPHPATDSPAYLLTYLASSSSRRLAGEVEEEAASIIAASKLDARDGAREPRGAPLDVCALLRRPPAPDAPPRAIRCTCACARIFV